MALLALPVGETLRRKDQSVSCVCKGASDAPPTAGGMVDTELPRQFPNVDNGPFVSLGRGRGSSWHISWKAG